MKSNVLRTSLIAGLILISFQKNLIAQSDIKELNIDGLKVYLKQTPKEVISARLFVKGGTANYSLNQEGIEDLAFTVATTGGTTTKNKTEFNSEAEKLGAQLGSSASLDFSEMNLSCVKPFWDQSWALFADAIMNPAFDAQDFAVIQQQSVATAKQREADPDAYLQQLSQGTVFKDRNYEKQPNGTSDALNKLTADEAKNFYRQDVVKSRVFLVVVGDISESDLTAKVKSTLAKLPGGTPASMTSRYVITKGGESIIDRTMATNYLNGYFTVPLLQSSDGIPMQLAMSILYDRLFIDIRTKRGLSYAPAAGLNSNALQSPYGYLYVSTDSPKACIGLMTDEMDQIKKDGFTQDELNNKKEQFLTGYLMNLETSDAQSLGIGKWVIRGNAHLFSQFTQMVNAVTLKDLNRVFDQNTGAIVWTYLGSKSDVTETDFKQPQTYQNKPY